MMHRTYPSLPRLRALEAVCRTGSFSAAASELLLTQPAVSAQIAQLEDEIGAPLVERIGKTARPTHAGGLLIAGAARVFVELESALDRIDAFRGEVAGPLRIGAGGTAATYLLPRIMTELQAAHPRVAPSIQTGNTPTMVVNVVAARLDIAVVTAPVSHRALDLAPFFEDRLVCILPKSERVVAGELRPRDFRGRRLLLYGPGGLIRETIDSWLARAPNAKPDIVEIESAEAQKGFVEAGFGWAIVSEMAVAGDATRRGYRIVPLSPRLSRRLVVAWRRDRTANPQIAAARRLFADYSAALPLLSL